MEGILALSHTAKCGDPELPSYGEKTRVPNGLHSVSSVFPLGENVNNAKLHRAT